MLWIQVLISDRQKLRRYEKGTIWISRLTISMNLDNLSTKIYAKHKFIIPPAY